VNSKGFVSNCLINLKILKILNIDHLQRFKNFEIEKDVLLEKLSLWKML